MALPTTSGLLRRLAALFYDSFLLLAILFFATAIILPFNEGEALVSGQILYSLYLLLVTFLFFGWFWTHGGQTLGMRAWKIKLCSQQTHRSLNWQQATIRFLAALVSLIPLGAGFFWIMIDRDKLSWHDRFSKTIIIRI
ncbi:MAG: RDD family protein [Methylococcales bacterium]